MMNKALKRISAVVLMLVLALCAFGFAACGDDEKEVESGPVTVTFDMGGSGLDDIEVTIESGETVSVPADPESDYGIFSGWYGDKDCTENFDFTQAIKKNTTIYAGWVVVPDGSIALTFMWNYGGLGVYSVGVVTSGKPLTASDLPTPTREGYKFDRWYRDAECTQAVSTGNSFTESMTFYAGWVVRYKFEAEYTNLYDDDDEMRSFNGYSQNGSPVNASADCSNGYYFASLYLEGEYMYFEIVSDCDCTAELYMCCGMEFGWGLETGTVDIESSDFTITVNGGSAISYPTMTFDVTNVPSNGAASFAEFYIGSIELNEGTNIIRMETTNDDGGQGGSQYGKAPAIDYIIIEADAELSMKIYENV